MPTDAPIALDDVSYSFGKGALQKGFCTRGVALGIIERRKVVEPNGNIGMVQFHELGMFLVRALTQTGN